MLESETPKQRKKWLRNKNQKNKGKNIVYNEVFQNI